MKSFSTLLFTVAALAAAVSLPAAEQINVNSGGLHIGGTTADKIGFHGSTPTAQRSGADQAALTDSTGGSVSGSTLASTAGISTLAIPVQLASLTTSAADLVTDYTPGFKFKILAVSFATTTLGTGSGASQVLNLEIGSTNVTGGAVTVTLAGTDTLGELTAGTSVTAANTGSATDTISVEVAASGTVFTAGSGVLLIRIQNMDVQDNAAKTAELVNELRAALVAKGLIKGSS
jgi:hypothetical protein